MNIKESNNLICEYIGRSRIKEIDEHILGQIPINSEGMLDPLSLSTEFGSSGGLMSEFDIAVRLNKTVERLKEIELEAISGNIELPR